MSAVYSSLEGKVVLITGGAEGIAASAVELFCKQGSKVIFFDISVTSAQALIDKIQNDANNNNNNSNQTRTKTTTPEFLHCDVTDLSRLQHCASQVLSTHGHVDVLINSAAAAGTKSRVPSSQVTPESWEFDMNVNLRHIFFLTQYLVPSMQARGSGSIINMGSITWKIPAVGVPVYTAAKAAILGLTKTHSKEYGAQGVRVNSVMPGAIATERQVREVLTPEYRRWVMERQTLQRDLMPREVASVVLFLASEDSSGVTGSSYVVDGGLFRILEEAKHSCEGDHVLCSWKPG